MDTIYIALICLGVAAALAGLGLFVYFSNNLLKVTDYTLTDARIRAEGIKIVHLSDLHGKSFKKDNKRLVLKIKKLSPDLIAITGDVIHKYRERDISVAVKLIGSLRTIAPVVYVSGNHEMRRLSYRIFREKLKKAGALVLDDEKTEMFGITICGVNCASIKKGEYFALADGVTGYKLLLAHLPQYITRYAAAGYDAALCGHAHGGQWRIPFTGVGFFSPGQGLFPKYTSGVHSCGNMREVISRGLGNSQCPLRLFNPPEIVVVNLKIQ